MGLAMVGFEPPLVEPPFTAVARMRPTSEGT
jgi:hypothetical protein